MKTERGFSMIETLIAAALIGAIAIGIIPLFTRSMIDNMAGADYTRVTNYARSKEEDFHRIPWLLPPAIQIQSGQTQSMTTEFMDPTTLRWVPNSLSISSAVPVWTRSTTYTQYNLGDLATPNASFTNQLDGADLSQPDKVQILQAQVQVKSSSVLGPMGVHRTTLVRYLKGF